MMKSVMSDKTVLFVDDEENILTALNRLLRKEDYSILTAGSGTEALALLEESEVQLVISDQRMPEITGAELLKVIKELYPDMVRVVLSGYAESHAILESINKGEVYRFLVKPWGDGELKMAIRQCLNHYDLLQERRVMTRKICVQNEELRQVNENLEDIVAKRTLSLQLSQEILAKLPLPVIGISADGMIVMRNEAAGRCFPCLPPTAIGGEVDSFLPAAVAEEVLECMKETVPKTFLYDSGRDDPVRVQIELLNDHSFIRGCLVMFQKESTSNG